MIGIVGKYCSGKDTAAAYIESKGFQHVSLSGILAEELQKNGLEVNRQNQIMLGNKLREEYGPSVLAVKALQKIGTTKNVIISSIRNPSEVDALRKQGNFVLVSIDADPHMRFSRMLARNDGRDNNITFEQFMLNELAEQSNDPNKQQLHKVIEMADITVMNDGTPAEFSLLLDEFLKGQNVYKRPTWDQYFMEMTRVVGLRGTCDRGRSGSVIVKDKHVLTTGYVGAPIGLAHCDEVGHKMQEVIHPDGQKRQHCV